MKIGIVTFTEDAQIGGGFNYVQEILQGLMKKVPGSRHTFYLIGQEERKPAHLDGINLRWLSLRWQEPTKPPVSDAEYYPEIYQENLDLLCHLHPWSHWFCKIKDIPYFTNVWDLQHRLQAFFPEVTSRGEFDRREEMYGKALGRAACIIASNEVGKREIVNFFRIAPERIRAIEHPTPSFALAVNLAEPPGALRNLGIKGEYVFYPAQFWPHKNHILLFLMLRQLHREHGLYLNLILTGSDRGNLPYLRQKVAEFGLEKRVIFPGFIAQSEMVALYRNAVALVFPSFFGPENLPPLEAFALGCPVIAADVAGAREQMGEAAILLDPTKPEAWSEAVIRVRQDAELRKSLIIRGRKRAESFTSEDFASELLQLFDEFALYRRTWPSSEDKIRFVPV